jgi:hypothetical protein
MIEVPISFAGEVVVSGFLLEGGLFTYEVLDSDLMALIHTKKAQVVVDETDGSYSAEICLIV